MKEHITVVYYDSFGNVGAFHVINANYEDLQGAYYDRDIKSIKNITIETDALSNKRFTTIFTEKDIAHFIKKWNLDY